MWKQYWPIYERLEKEVCDFTFQVALAVEQLGTYSIRLAELILRICSDCENCAKTLVKQLVPSTSVKNTSFPKIGNIFVGTCRFPASGNNNRLAISKSWH